MKIPSRIALAISMLLALLLPQAGTAQGFAYPAQADALDALESNLIIKVTQTPQFIRFDNQFITRDAGLLIQPGGDVDPRSYARIARKISALGYPVVIDTTPSVLVIAGVLPSMIPAIKAANPDVQSWALAGHSLGGVLASRYIAQNPQDFTIKGLALWGSFADPENPIPYRTDLVVASIYGELDCLVPPQTAQSFAWALPFNATFQQIDGANHAQWGDYGEQAGDCAADITPTQQKIYGKRATVELVLSKID